MRPRFSSALYGVVLLAFVTIQAAGQATPTANRDSSVAAIANASNPDTSATARDSASAATQVVASTPQEHHRSLLSRALARTGAELGQSKAMMVVGLGGLIVGAIIGGTPGTIIMVGGAVVGLVGLYNYLQ